MAEIDKKKLERLVAELRDLQAKTYAITEEIQTVLGGGVGIAEKLKQLEQTFSTLWRARYGSSYIWNYGKDRAQSKRLLGTLATIDIEKRMVVYLKDTDDFYVRSRHPFGLFVSSVNRHAEVNADAGELTLEAPPDCKHRPPCGTDQEHTRRRMEDMKR